MNISFPIPMQSYCSLKEQILSLSYNRRNMIKRLTVVLSYFFCYKTEFLSFQNNPKNLDPSYKMDLDL